MYISLTVVILITVNAVNIIRVNFMRTSHRMYLAVNNFLQNLALSDTSIKIADYFVGSEAIVHLYCLYASDKNFHRIEIFTYCSFICLL